MLFLNKNRVKCHITAIPAVSGGDFILGAPVDGYQAFNSPDPNNPTLFSGTFQCNVLVQEGNNWAIYAGTQYQSTDILDPGNFSSYYLFESSAGFDIYGNVIPVTFTTNAIASIVDDGWTSPIAFTGYPAGYFIRTGNRGNILSVEHLTTLANFGITDAVQSNTAITAGTGTKITYDSKGLVLSSTVLASTDIPNLDWSKISTGKPTTLSGYGITDSPVPSSSTPSNLGTAAVGTSTTYARADHIHNTEIPSQTGNSGKYLKTDGSTTSWATISANPLGYLYSGTITTTPTGSGEDTLIIGDGASAGSTTRSVVIGYTASAGSNSAVAIGEEARATATTAGLKAIALGQYAYANPQSSGWAIAIGSGRSASTAYGALNNRTIAVGTDSIASGTDGIAVGGYATASGSGAVAIGSSSAFNGGAQATASGGGPISIGAGSIASTTGAIAIGNSAKTGTGIRQIVIDSSGNGSTHTGLKSIVISTDTSQAYTQDSCVIIGQTPGTNSSTGVTLIGNCNSIISSGANYSSIIGGSAGRADMYGENVRANGQFSSAGDAQASHLIGRIITSNATVTEIALDGSSARIVLTNDSTYLFDVDVVARNTTDDTQSAAWNLKFAIRRGAAAANTSLIGTPVKVIFGQDTGSTTWDVNVTADTTNGRPNISVQGEAAKTIRWVANLRITKVQG